MTDLNAKQLGFVDKWVHCQDDEKAAQSAGYRPGWGARLRRMPLVSAEIDRRMLILNTEQAKLTIKKRELCKDLLDDELTSVIKIDVKERPTLGPTKLNAIEMGYRRVGMIAGGEFVPDQETTQDRPNEAPRIYRASEANIITHRIETLQQVTTREIVSSIPESIAKSPYEY